MLSNISTPNELQGRLATALRTVRRSKKHSRKEASLRSGVPESTIRRFESTGEISLRQLLMLCDIYGDLAAAETLFPAPTASTMDELLALNAARK